MFNAWIVFVVLACVVLAVLAVLADVFARRWIKRLQKLEHARVDWQARVIESQVFWRKP